jgi:sigma-B regulation protein RsbU (phosphoserine phosphatase)
VEQDIHELSVEILKKENERLNRAVYELSILNDLAREIGASINSQDVMQTVISRSLRAVNASQGVITLSPHGKNAKMKTLVRSMATTGDKKPYQVDQALLGWMQLNKSPLLISDPRSDRRFQGVIWDDSIKSVLCVPLLIKSQLTGILTVFNKRNGETFTVDDQRLLAILAAQSAQVVENARLHEEEHNYLRVQEELRLAIEIQTGLLPKEFPKIPGYDIKGMSLPAHSVGGDYYDFIMQDDDHLAVCLGDVAGKGLPAALVMSNMQATIRGQALVEHSPAHCLTLANRLLYHSTTSNKFATLFYGQLHKHSHEFYYANAGHNRPILFRQNGDIETLETAGVALSIVENENYQDDKIDFEPGDILLIYSDGITEAMNPGQEEFEEQRLRDIVLQHRNESAESIIAHIKDAVNAFVESSVQNDDMTLVVIKRT